MNQRVKIGGFVRVRHYYKNWWHTLRANHFPCWLHNLFPPQVVYEELWNGKEWIDRNSKEGLELCPPLNITLQPGESVSFVIPISKDSSSTP